MVFAPGDSRGRDSEESFGCGDDLVYSSDVFSASSTSSSGPLPFRSLRLKRPLSIPFFSRRPLSSLPLLGRAVVFSSDSRLGLVLSGYQALADAEHFLFLLGSTSLVSTDLIVELLESSRSKLGVRLIFRVSTPSSLKNESVLRTVPFLDLIDVSFSVMLMSTLLIASVGCIPVRSRSSSIDWDFSAVIVVSGASTRGSITVCVSVRVSRVCRGSTATLSSVVTSCCRFWVSTPSSSCP